MIMDQVEDCLVEAVGGIRLPKLWYGEKSAFLYEKKIHRRDCGDGLMKEGIHMQNNTKRLKQILEDLTGQEATLDSPVIDEASKSLAGERGIGESQFNELLILHGYDRIRPAFFQYLVDGSAECKPGVCIHSFDQLEKGVERFQKLALQAYGNVKYGFKRLSTDPSLLWRFVSGWASRSPEEYQRRHDAILPVNHIDGRDTYFLGLSLSRELGIKKRI